MGRAAIALLLVIALGAPAEAASPRASRASARAAAHARTHRARPHPAPGARPAALADAEASMKALMRDRTRRRYRHHWERAIGALVAAAHGKDAPVALLSAARARYALYRWSANEADRDEALRLATRSAKAGSREAPALLAAIRREAGDERPSRPAAPARAAPPRAPAAPREERAEEVEADEDSPPDPALEAALADVSAAERAPALALGATRGTGPARVSEVRTWSAGDYTRVAIYLSHWVGWQKLELAPEGDRPRRLALDLRPARLEGKALARVPAGEQVDRVRAAQNDADTVRVVLDLPGADDVQLFGLDDPPRLIVDVGTHAARKDARVAAADAAPAHADAAPAPPEPPHAARPAPASLVVPRAPEERLPPGPIRRIVVDAGHGGHDPGAIGPSRVREKDVTLALAKRLARKLRGEGFEVVLTRSTDRFIALEERTAIANTARADLFVSVHANASPRRRRSGVETYFLNVADDRYAARLAARENGADPGEEQQGRDVQRILTDLDAKASAGASRSLAQLVQREVCGGVRSRIGEVHDLGVKSALFYVLLGARMPAVLVETAFISNRDEERRLASTRYQDEVAGGIARAVAAFAHHDARVAAAR